MRVHRIKPDQAQRRLDADEPVLFIDARAPKEYERSNEQLPGSVRILADKVADHLAELPRDRTIITYCTWTNEASSARAALTLMQAGYSNVFALEGGFNAWVDGGHPTELKPELPTQPSA